ncbi:MAG: hypothetical protein ACXAB7_05980 [Candidatus Kariarchaeaceae archaeon]
MSIYDFNGSKLSSTQFNYFRNNPDCSIQQLTAPYEGNSFLIREAENQFSIYQAENLITNQIIPEITFNPMLSNFGYFWAIPEEQGMRWLGTPYVDFLEGRAYAKIKVLNPNNSISIQEFDFSISSWNLSLPLFDNVQYSETSMSHAKVFAVNGYWLLFGVILTNSTNDGLNTVTRSVLEGYRVNLISKSRTPIQIQDFPAHYDNYYLSRNFITDNGKYLVIADLYYEGEDLRIVDLDTGIMQIMPLFRDSTLTRVEVYQEQVWFINYTTYRATDGAVMPSTHKLRMYDIKNHQFTDIFDLGGERIIDQLLVVDDYIIGTYIAADYSDLNDPRWFESPIMYLLVISVILFSVSYLFFRKRFWKKRIDKDRIELYPRND